MKEYTYQEAINLLKEGNKRYSENNMIHPSQKLTRMLEVVCGQNPFAVILTCSDSRVVPEFIFDRGVGDLFVIRNAGNIVDEHVLGSIEYAVEHLHTPIVLVLGHTDCGAVTAAHKGLFSEGHLNSVLKEIEPVIDRNTKGEFGMDNSIRNNVIFCVDKIKNSDPILSKFVKDDKVRVIGAIYDLNDGEVNFID
ncbi:MAG: carbonic anhydrase [Candidatus Delongbacteria bacterium]|nr:carbonic anhydrase [Candidatus Delongbacteria bacterium]MCG2760212.1 carbonic anhydrase [Candidatus Delongbacteria bacterium]